MEDESRKKRIPNLQLREERKKRGWTQKDLADQIGLPDSSRIGRWERGESFPQPHYRLKLSRVFEKSLEELGLLAHPSSVDEGIDGATPKSVYLLYAYEDREWASTLKKHLHFLSRIGLIRVSPDSPISAGYEWESAVSTHLNIDEFILILVSPDLLKLDECYSATMQHVLERHRLGEARVIPILLRPCLWEVSPFGQLQVLPLSGQFVSALPVPMDEDSLDIVPTDEDLINIAQGQIAETFVEIVRNLQQVIEDPQKMQHWRPMSAVSADISREARTQVPLSLFYSYAHKDEDFCRELDIRLAPLKQLGLITSWHYRDILPGVEWAKEIDRYLNAAQVLLLFISSDFLNSDYCYSKEMERALQRHAAAEAQVIPIFLRRVDCEGAPFEHLGILPSDSQPVTGWSNRDAAYLDIARTIQKIALGQDVVFGSFPPGEFAGVRPSESVDIFCAYEKRDEHLGNALKAHSALLRRIGIINNWHTRAEEVESEISDDSESTFDAARIILPLISADFLASAYGIGAEMRRALDKHKTGAARVVPLLARPVDWAGSPFSILPALPENGRPISTWPDQDEICYQIMRSIRTGIFDPHAPIGLLLPTSTETLSIIQPIEILCVYAREDRDLYEELASHIVPLQQAGLVKDLYSREIDNPYWGDEIDSSANTAHMILLLVSPALLALGYDSTAEMRRIHERRNTGDVILIPVLARPVDYRGTSFDELQPSPGGNVPVTSNKWQSRDEAWTQVTKDIRSVIPFPQERTASGLSVSAAKVMTSSSSEVQPVEVLCVYVREDSNLYEELTKHMSSLQQAGLVRLFGREMDTVGSEEHTVSPLIETARIILLLVSADSLASEYWYSEMQRAIARVKANEARVIPILLRPTAWQDSSPLADLQPLPSDTKPVTQWSNQDEAFVDIANAIRHVLNDMLLVRDASAPGAKVAVIWSVPYPHNPFFVGRENVLAAIHEHFTGTSEGLRKSDEYAPSPLALAGLGGIGKTQIALEYAYHYRQEYRTVLWARADTNDALNTSYTEIAMLLKLAEKDAIEQEVIVQAVKTWLRNNQRWLLILDNANEPAILVPFLPENVTGHLLVTTRAADLTSVGIAHSLEIALFPAEQSAHFLLQRANLLALDTTMDQATPQDRTLALQIAQELGDLPLALDQAGAYIGETGCSLADYLALFQQHRADLLKRRRDQAYPNSVATTWSLSFERVQDRNPAAADLLRLCIFLAPDAIGEELFTGGAEELGPVLAPVAADSYLLDQAIETVRSYSLLKRDPVTRTLAVHLLVQAVLRDNMDDETQRLWAERAVRMVHRAFLYSIPTENRQRTKDDFPHALICAKWIQQYDFNFPETIDLLLRIAEYLRVEARDDEALQFLQKALAISERTLGPSNPRIVTILTILRDICQSQGKYDEATAIRQRIEALQAFATSQLAADAEKRALASIELVQADLLDLTVDALVHGVGLDLARGGEIGEQLIGRVGRELARQLQSDRRLEPAEVVIADGGSLSARYLLSVCIENSFRQHSIQSVTEAVYSVLAAAESLSDCRSLAFPSLGTGSAGLDPSDTAPEILKAVVSHLMRNSHLQHVIFALHDEITYQAYADAYHSLEEKSEEVHPVSTVYRVSISTKPDHVTVGQHIYIQVALLPASVLSSENIVEVPISASDVHCRISSDDGLRVYGSSLRAIPVDSRISDLTPANFELEAHLRGSRPFTVDFFIEDPQSSRLTIARLTDYVTVEPPMPGEDRPSLLPTLKIRVAPLPDLVLEVDATPTSRAHQLTYRLTSRLPFLQLEHKKVGEVTLREVDLASIKMMIRQTVQRAINSQPEDAYEQMLSMGIYLFDRLFPADSTQDFRDIYWNVADRITTWLVIEDGIVKDGAIWLPWELVVPHRPENTATLCFWGERYHLSRWVEGLGSSLQMYNEIPIGEKIALAHYKILERGQEDQDEELLGWQQLLNADLAHGITQVVKPETPVFGLHLLRHSDQITTQDIALRGGSTIVHSPEGEMPQACLDLWFKRPLITLGILTQDEKNAVYNDSVDNWPLPERARTFLSAGASAVIGPWWPTSADADRVFWPTFYDLLARRIPLGEAVWRARLAVHRLLPHRPDWLAYALFGDPRARSYRPQPSEGYTALECINRDEPLRPGKTYYFRISIRNRPPTWFQERLSRVENLPNDASVLFLAPGLQVTPSRQAVMRPVDRNRTLLQATVGLTAPRPGNYPILVHLLEGEEHLKTLQLTLEVENTPEGVETRG